MDEVQAGIQRTIGLALGVAVGPELRRADEPRWDSLKHVEIIFALEDAFDVRFAEDDLPRLDSIAALCRAIADLKGGTP